MASGVRRSERRRSNPNTATEPATTIAAAMLIANGTRFM